VISCASITGYRDVIEDSNLRFAVVPGHEAGKDESSVHKLARMLSAYYGRADYSRCLRRKHNMAKLSTGGSRSLLKQYQSMEVDARYTVSGKKFLLLDDIVTTGNSMMAARKRLLEAGAAEVYPLAMAQTVLEPERVCQDKCVSFFAIRKAVRKGRLFYGKKLKIARTLAFLPEFFHQ